VDDEPDSLQLLHDLLSHHGIDVYQARGGQECLELLQSVTPTLIVMDLAMPKPDGWDVLEQIRANPSLASVPIIAVTAYHSGTLARQVLEAGFTAYIPKPIKSREFMQRLQELAL
jgi:two-component system cell cycle response regulator DivK